MSDLKKLGEFGLIKRLSRRFKTRSKAVLTGIGDDCAVYRARPGMRQVTSTDALVETVHFDLATTTPEQLGRKALAVNLSDIAAMGATPILALVTLGLPPGLPLEFLDRLYKGLSQSCKRYGVELAGGDTVKSPQHLFLNITVIGEVAAKRIFTRDGARPGDIICVTGTLGDSALGLQILKSPKKDWQGSARHLNFLKKAHLDPTPRLAEAALLARSRLRVTSMIDLSDGLTGDLSHLIEGSGLGALIKAGHLPESPAFSQVTRLNSLKNKSLFLSGGEDYELLFTIKAIDVKQLIRQFQNAKAPVTPIGEITEGTKGITLVQPDGSRETLLKSMGFDHFAGT